MNRTNLNDVYGSAGDSNDKSGIDTSCGNIDNCVDGDRKIDYGDNVDFNIGMMLAVVVEEQSWLQ